jgi:hypothetical protein
MSSVASVLASKAGKLNKLTKVYNGLQIELKNQQQKVGSIKITQNVKNYKLSPKLSIVSRNGGMKDRNPNELGNWLGFIESQFDSGVWAVCIQDCPKYFADSFDSLGITAVVNYSQCIDGSDQSQLGECVTNTIVFNPNWKIDLDNIKIWYLAEIDGSVKEICCGCVLLDVGEYVIGSIYDSFLSNSRRRAKNWKQRAEIFANLSKVLAKPIIAVGDLNPRGNWWPLQIFGDLSNILPRTGIQKLDDLIYKINLIPFILLGRGNHGPAKELKDNSKYGIIPSPEPTMSPSKFGPINIDTIGWNWVIDGVQTTLKKNQIKIKVLNHSNLTDHAPIMVNLI